MANTWYDGDGLLRKYGTAKATATTAGEYAYDGPTHVVEVKIDLTTLGTAAAIQSDVCVIPSGYRIEQVEVITQTAATGTGAVLNVGFIREDRSTQLDYDGLIAALALTSIDAAGEKTTINVGSTSAGALLGTTLAYAGYITADYDTAAYTAGVVYIRIRYYKP